jgi:predicted O-methyltransferase YrrM
MLRDCPLHNFLFETDPDGFYDGLSTFCTPWIDVCVLLHLIRKWKPQRFLEVGTHRGYTTRILAERFPAMSIVTVDPGDQVSQMERPANQQGEYLTQDEVGDLVRNISNVQVIQQRFEDVSWADNRFDMIFIDGNHSLASVLADSHLALSLVTNPGVIVWHDVNNVESVNQALEMLVVDRPIVSLHNTWVAYLDTH